jgi:glutathione S-transferase
MHSGFRELRKGMSFNLCFLPEPPPAPAEAVAEGREMLGFFEDALQAKRLPGPFLFGGFCAADVMYAPAIVRLTAFKVPAADTPLAASYMPAVLSHPPVKRWLDAARALPPRATY